MTRGARWSLLALLLGAAGCRRGPPRAGAAPPFVVTVVVDQLAAWIAAERWPALPADGGFARLRREGLYVQELRYGQALTDTAPGHAALYTGAVARATGIFGNEVIAAPGSEPVSILEDPTTRTVVPSASRPQERGDPGSSLRRLRVETLADVLVAERPGALVFSASLKERGALFGAGRRPTAVLWLDPRHELFVTSSVYPGIVPAGVAAAVSHDVVVRARAEPWALADAAWTRAHAETADDQAGEGSYQGLGTTFPHPLTSGKALRATPRGDALLLGAAVAWIEHAAGQRRPTLLALSFSSNDYVGHIFGPQSYESWDELLRLDGVLRDLLAELDRRLGPRGYAVMLTGDHGVAPLPELTGPVDPWCRHAAAAEPDRWQRACIPRRRVDPHQVAATLERELGAALGAGPWVAGLAEPWVFLTAAARALPAAKRQLLLATARRSLSAAFGIAGVVDARAQTAPCAPLPDESLDALVCRAIVPDGGADLYLVLPKGAFFDTGYVEGYGTSHGSPSLYDRAVPLLVRAPGRVRAGQVISEPVAFTAFARTAAALLGIRPPAAAADGRDLTAAP